MTSSPPSPDFVLKDAAAEPTASGIDSTQRPQESVQSSEPPKRNGALVPQSNPDAAVTAATQRHGGSQRPLGRSFSALINSFGMRGKQVPPHTKNGAFNIGTETFQQSCAILTDGSVCFVRAYHTAEIAAELTQLRKTYDLPAETERRAVTLAAMAALYGRKAEAVVEHRPTSGQLRLQKVLVEAAALGASDIKLIERATHGLLRIKVGAGEFTHGSEWQVHEVKEAIAWIYGHRDGGDGKATLIKGQPAPFSIGQADKLPAMPKGVAAMRGQIAWHGDLQNFLNLRLLPTADARNYADVAGLGLEDDILEALAAERRSEAGLVIIGGSTGDGKSTTLVRNLERLYEERDGQVSLYTIEDPVEYPATGDGVIQFPVRGGKTPAERKANYTQMLMTFVRTNPDIGMVSEIRSADDVNEVLHFVTSGHKIYTTVHANSAVGVLFRLISLGVLPSELSGPDVVNLVLRQKLVPKLCPHCAEPLRGAARQIVEDWLQSDRLFMERVAPSTFTLRRRNPTGCDECLAGFADMAGPSADTARAAWAGYMGRRATAEYIPLDDTYREYVGNHDQLGARKYWLASAEETSEAHPDGGMGGVPIMARLRRLVAIGEADYELITNETLPEPLLEIEGPQPLAGAAA
ncbi:MAG: ATPase, T2SS/T4P/T4SS family [Aestuariivita sp.]|nr:ATPase, T2SS/T4P/T4SS family [Aestuariivita sp.]MCY4345408.1 ATPase, T2SS/T4P/T4SS family [Aestuariivita sp.]